MGAHRLASYLRSPRSYWVWSLLLLDLVSGVGVALGGLPALLGGAVLLLFSTGYPLVRLLSPKLLDNHTAALAASIGLSIPVSSIVALPATRLGLEKTSLAAVYIIVSTVLALLSALVESRRPAHWAGC